MAATETYEPGPGAAGQIPVIDLSGSISESHTAKALVDAAATYGFVYIKNNGKDVPVEVIKGIFDLSRQFFSLPVEEKLPYTIQEDNRGWSGMHSETLDPKNQKRGDFKEAMNLAEFVNEKPQQPLPEALTSREADLYAFQNYCNNLMLKILTLFAIGLNIDHQSGGRDWFSSRHRGGPSGCTLRLLKYPTVPTDSDFNPTVDIRAGAHSDYGSITLLFQRPGQPGLEIIPPASQIPGQRNTSNNASWTPVPVFPPGTESDPSPPILVNIGDLLSYWTNNLFKSTVHRVVFPKGAKEGGEDRYSIAYFGHPVGATVLEPVPSDMVSALKGVDGVGPELGKPITADEHLMTRLKATYLGLYRDEEGKKDTSVAV